MDPKKAKEAICVQYRGNISYSLCFFGHNFRQRFIHPIAYDDFIYWLDNKTSLDCSSFAFIMALRFVCRYVYLLILLGVPKP